MNLEKIKASIPGPLKRVLRPPYRLLMWLYQKYRSLFYRNRLADEIARFDAEIEVNDLPEIFHYWSNRYLRPQFQSFGFENPDEFFGLYAQKAIQTAQESARILSIGSGNCDTEVHLATTLLANGCADFKIHCMDINQVMLQRGRALAKEAGVADHLVFVQADFNAWKGVESYDMVLANQCLHHVVELEHLFDEIKLALRSDGYFVTADTIGRNGHMRWPEAVAVIKPIWDEIPDRYRYNHAFNRTDQHFVNHNCAQEGFEGIRAQDVLPLLHQRFGFELFIPFANLVLLFVDRTYGPNFDVDNPEDLAFIDRIQAVDEDAFAKGIYQPTQMMAVMRRPELVTETTLLTPRLTPEAVIRTQP